MQIKIQRVDKTLPLPKYETSGACCFDLLVRETLTIAPHQLALIPTNLIIEVPVGYMFIIAPRSSTPKKKGLLVPHGIGIIDQDFHGPKDEILFQVLNFTGEGVTVFKGERLVQGCLVPIVKPEFVEVDEDLKDKSRGGIGSTG